MMNCRRILSTICLFFVLGMAFAQHPAVQTGDLLFVGIPSDYTIYDDTTMTGAIAAATGSGDTEYIHVAILEVDAVGDLWIIDATLKHGVARYPIDTFLTDFTLKDGSQPLLRIMRLNDNRHAAEYVENAKRFCGLVYNMAFVPDPKAKYCSELVRDSYIENGDYIFTASPMNFKGPDGTFPLYWVQLFELIGQPIPQGVLGTNPNDMIKEKCIHFVGDM